MPAIFITLLIVGLVVYGFYWLGGKLPSPFGRALQIIAGVGGLVWLIVHVREIVGAITSL